MQGIRLMPGFWGLFIEDLCIIFIDLLTTKSAFLTYARVLDLLDIHLNCQLNWNFKNRALIKGRYLASLVVFNMINFKNFLKWSQKVIKIINQ